MQRKIKLLEHTDRDVVALQSSYPAGHIVARHAHWRVQLLYATEGILQLETGQGSWIVPPGFALWIPAGVDHELRTTRAITRSLYFRPACLRPAPGDCQVIEVTALLRSLIDEAVKIPALYDIDQRDGALMQLLILEAIRLPSVPFHLPMPQEPQLGALCRAFCQAPTQVVTPMQWADKLHVSERTFYRRFVTATGLSFIAWRRQACVFVAISRLSRGESVTRIALDMGYESTSAFSAMFRKMTGKPPSAYTRNPGDRDEPASEAGL